MATTIGSTGKSGSPVIKLTIRGMLGSGTEFEATVDTGFTGFISMPIMSALPLGLTLYGTTSVQFGDGKTSDRFTALGSAMLGTESEVGVIILEPSTTEVLVGMAFLTSFKKTLFFYRAILVLIDESEMDTMMLAALNQAANATNPELTPPEKSKRQ